MKYKRVELFVCIQTPLVKQPAICLKTIALLAVDASKEVAHISNRMSERIA